MAILLIGYPIHVMNVFGEMERKMTGYIVTRKGNKRLRGNILKENNLNVINLYLIIFLTFYYSSCK